MRNGKLRHKMTLQEPVDVQDTTTGEMVRTWQDVAKVWASLEPLSAREFVAAGAEQSEVSARVTIRYREGVTSKMRLVYRGMAYDIKGVLADPKSGLEYLTLPVGEGVRYEDPAPPACAITLTGDIAAVFGGQPLDISGQMVSKTVPASPASTYAAGVYPDSINLNWSGRRAIAKQVSVFNTSGLTTWLLTNPTFTKLVQLAFVNGVWQVNDGSAENKVDFGAGTGLEKVAFVVDGATGDIEAWVDGVSVTKNDLAPWMASFFAGETAIYSADTLQNGAVPLAEGDTFSAQIFTAAADLDDVGFPAGTLDWCGNEI